MGVVREAFRRLPTGSLALGGAGFGFASTCWRAWRVEVANFPKVCHATKKMQVE